MAQVVGSNRKRWLEAILVYAVLAVLVLAFVFPLIWALGLSLKTRLQIFATPPLYLWWPTLANYADVLTRADFARSRSCTAARVQQAHWPRSPPSIHRTVRAPRIVTGNAVSRSITMLSSLPV